MIDHTIPRHWVESKSVLEEPKYYRDKGGNNTTPQEDLIFDTYMFNAEPDEWNYQMGNKPDCWPFFYLPARPIRAHTIGQYWEIHGLDIFLIAPRKLFRAFTRTKLFGRFIPKIIHNWMLKNKIYKT